MNKSYNNFLRVLRNPRLLIGKGRQTSRKINIYLSNDKVNNGCSIMQQDWDNLYILDGCRYDMFSELNYYEGDLSKKVSKGSMSMEFIQENFLDKELHDTVYVTANPYSSQIDEGVFHDTINLLDKWDHTYQTVLPETVRDALLAANNQYPNKRLIGHFMQPHHPFIGKLGEEFQQDGFQKSLDNSSQKPSIWAILRYGYHGYDGVTEEKVWSAYKENLEIVLDYLESLFTEIPGKSVVTSDHGNMVGERMSPIPAKEYGHPAGLREPELIEVPWFVASFNQRKSLVSEPPEAKEKIDESVVADRLNALGYK